VIKFPVERLFHVDGTPRERFVPSRADRNHGREDSLGTR
jgi:hypothetical protein